MYYFTMNQMKSSCSGAALYLYETEETGWVKLLLSFPPTCLSGIPFSPYLEKANIYKVILGNSWQVSQLNYKTPLLLKKNDLMTTHIWVCKA